MGRTKNSTTTSRAIVKHEARPEVVGDVEIHPSAKISTSSSINAGAHGRIRIGAGVNVKAGARIVAYGGLVALSVRVSVGENCVIYGHGGVSIGPSTAIGPLTFIGSQEHIRSAEQPLRYSGEIVRAVRIGAGVIISANCIITAGVTIGDGAFVGGGSLVFDDIPAGQLAFGSPCKPVGAVGRNPLLGWNDWITNDGGRDETGGGWS